MQQARPAHPLPASYCRKCGSRMETRVPAREREQRLVCPSCGFVDYVNPKMVRRPSWPVSCSCMVVALLCRCI